MSGNQAGIGQVGALGRRPAAAAGTRSHQQLREVIRWTRLALLATVPWLLLLTGILSAAEEIEFRRDVRPILSDNCFQCHGPDASSRQADLRLDEEQTPKPRTIVAGSPEESELLLRVQSTNPDTRMPPPDSGKELSRAEIQILRQWIQAGADYAQHWSFVVPEKPSIPSVEPASWVRNPIDAFVLKRLQQVGQAPAAEAPRSTLIRRLALDLTGLLPTTEQASRWMDPVFPLESIVDELLQSPHYGERMAMVWLDAARYSDSDGFQIDATRENWPWRDWVINAYNSNLRFDEFTRLQFAGDLLPDSPSDAILATCFHRNHMTNGEGGRDPEESRIDYVRDRVNTMGTVWLGLTLGCCQCHDHKYDPISQADYYSLAAFFNSIDEDGRAGTAAKPYLKMRSPYVAAGLEAAQRLEQSYRQVLQETREAAESRFDQWLSRWQQQLVESEYHSWHSLESTSLQTTSEQLQLQADHDLFRVTGPDPRHVDYIIAGRIVGKRITGIRVTVLPASDEPGSRLSTSDDGHFILTNLKLAVRDANNSQLQEVAVASAHADFEATKEGRNYGPVADVLDDDPRTGWTAAGSDPTTTRTAVFALAEPLELEPSQELVVELRQRSLKGYSNLRTFRIEWTEERGPTLETTAQSPLEQWGRQLQTMPEGELREQLFAQFLEDETDFIVARQRHQRAEAQLKRYQQASGDVSVMVLSQRQEPRATHVLLRGQWDQHGPQVEPAIPERLRPDTSFVVRDRLELAEWLTSRQNPLTARVAVNRYWQMLFGEGLVRTPEDFGAEGEPPTHPDLLDWLAVEFTDSGWNVKHMLKLITTSATYRQSSDVTGDQLARDPDNRLLGRGSRFRLPSWMIRDTALQAGGLLSTRLGGPPVFPYQPEGVWAESTMGRFHYQPSLGDDVHRRSIYAFWRRSVAPTYLFDAAKRRVCEIKVVRTNTPLQALTLLNDTSFVEAARGLAINAAGLGEDMQDDIRAMYRRTLLRDPSAAELDILQRQFDEAEQFYKAHPDEARALLNVGDPGDTTSLSGYTDSRLAALTMLASTLFNLDETVTHE